MTPSSRHQRAARALLDWYEPSRRDLPWRALGDSPPNPYHVWLSEIMLQQTTTATVRGYFEKFIKRWPRVEALAAAPRDEVMKAWAGLGYYARARNLHITAIEIASKHGGVFPSNEEDLRRLPGVGAYTAAAVAAIGFNRRAVVVDGNIERVTARWDGIKTPLPQAKPELYLVMDSLTPKRGEEAGDFAQAMMDLGAMICTPARKTKDGLTMPSCQQCPLKPTCKTTGKGAENYPFKTPKPPRQTRYGVAVVIEDGGQNVVLCRRPDKGMLGGLDVFPSSPWADGSSQQDAYPLVKNDDVSRAIQGGVKAILNTKVEHIFTHFRIVLTIHHVRFDDIKPPLPDGMNWVKAKQLKQRALPTVMVKVAKAAGVMNPAS